MRLVLSRFFAAAPALGAGCLLLGLAGVSPASVITYNPAPTTQAGWSACGSFPGYSCLTTAYFNTTTLDGLNQEGNIDNLFQEAWNAGANGGLTLSIATDARNNGVGGTFNITTATANQFTGVTLGGNTIQVDASNVVAGLPALGTGDVLVWTQGLYIDYTLPGGGIVTPYYVMDTSTLSSLACGGVSGNFCPPAYPYQYNDDSFYDQPRDYYMPPGATQAFFQADAYLAVMNSTKGTLELYDGISYGFTNYVSPEPGTWALLGGGLFTVLLLRRRRISA